VDALGEAGLAPPARLAELVEAWRLQQNLSQLLKVALEDGADPTDEPAALKTLLARAGGAKDFKSLLQHLRKAREAAHAAFLATISA
jgi:glutamate-ammonia-ligase adenylyltransferase